MDDISDAERALRVELAGLYRVFDHLGWAELIYNHISARVPESDCFLINPYGLHYNEVTASNLVKVDPEGNVVGESEHPINPAGFVIHSAVHAVRHDVLCVAHTHTTAGSVVAAQPLGLRADNFYSCIVADWIAYHDFEGITVRDGEKERLVANLGDKHLMILRSHGLLTCGSTVAACFMNMWVLQRACEIQVAVDAGNVPPLPVSPAAREASAKGLKVMMAQRGYGELELAAMMRQVDRVDASYRE